MATWDPLEMEFTIRQPPEAVRAWWTDLPDDYTATDKAEQPFRIVTREKRPDGRDLETHWKTPFGVLKLQESMRVRPDGTWTFDVQKAMFGLDARDEFVAEATPEGTRLRIRSTFIPRNAAHKVLGPVIVPAAKGMFRSNFTKAAKICERDAPAPVKQ